MAALKNKTPENKTCANKTQENKTGVNKTQANRIVITAGEPAGIGPDICIKLIAQAFATNSHTEIYILADPVLMKQRAEELGISINVTQHSNFPNQTTTYNQQHLNIIPVALKEACQTGVLNKANSPYVLDCLDIACDLCVNHRVDAMVTGPVHKSIINDAGIDFTGHTEYLADRVNATPVMMLATKQLRVALATTHLPLHAVSAAITAPSLMQTLKTLDKHLRVFCHIKNPEILVCGLNPHAGEDGVLGDEEIKTITPVIQNCKKQGLNLIGPLPADTLFTPRYLDSADAVLAMYHDQGLPVLKYSGFGKAVNITLGLPFVRTSVDHGTALDLAGTGKASASSLIEAIHMATPHS